MHIFCLDYTVSVSKSYPLRVQNKLTTALKQSFQGYFLPSLIREGGPRSGGRVLISILSSIRESFSASALDDKVGS